MKTRFYVLLISVFLSYSSLVFSQEYPPDATLVTIDSTTQGNNTNPTVLQKSFIEGSDDIRIHPTTNSTQSEMSIAISPINNQIILASA